jgi:hypothetical protein
MNRNFRAGWRSIEQTVFDGRGAMRDHPVGCRHRQAQSLSWSGRNARMQQDTMAHVAKSPGTHSITELSDRQASLEGV